MSKEMTVEDLMTFWRNHEGGIASPSVAEVRRQATRFQRGIQLWNVLHYVAGVVTMVLYGRLLLRRPSFLQGLGETLIIVASLCWLYQIRKGRSARSVSAALGLDTCIDFHRKELALQRDFLRKSWRYLLLPIPGFIALEIDAFLRLRYITLSQHIWTFVIAALFISLVIMARRRRANQLQREIDSIPGADGIVQ